MLATALLVGCADKHPHVLFTAVTTTGAMPCSDLPGVAPGSVVCHADGTYAFEMNEHASTKNVAAAATCPRSAQGVSGVSQRT